MNECYTKNAIQYDKLFHHLCKDFKFLSSSFFQHFVNLSNWIEDKYFPIHARILITCERQLHEWNGRVVPSNSTGSCYWTGALFLAPQRSNPTISFQMLVPVIHVVTKNQFELTHNQKSISSFLMTGNIYSANVNVLYV